MAGWLTSSFLPFSPTLSSFPPVARSLLQNPATLLCPRWHGGTEDGPDRLVEHRLQALLRQRGALQVLDATNLLGHRQALWVRDWRQFLVAQLLHCRLVVAQIQLGSDQDDRGARTVVAHFGVPFGAHVLKRRGIHQRETDEEHVRLWIAQRSQAIVVLLPGRIPKAQIDRLAIDHDIGRVIVESARAVSRLIIREERNI